MLERLNNNYPYYLDYFGIYKEYQNKGYGTASIKYLLNNIILDNGLVGEIEKVDNNDFKTVKRLEFYKRLGFKKIESEYLLFNVLYNPLVYLSKPIEKNEIDNILFKYYKTNSGLDDFNKYCKMVDYE